MRQPDRGRAACRGRSVPGIVSVVGRASCWACARRRGCVSFREWVEGVCHAASPVGRTLAGDAFRFRARGRPGRGTRRPHGEGVTRPAFSPVELDAAHVTDVVFLSHQKADPAERKKDDEQHDEDNPSADADTLLRVWLGAASTKRALELRATTGRSPRRRWRCFHRLSNDRGRFLLDGNSAGAMRAKHFSRRSVCRK